MTTSRCAGCGSPVTLRVENGRYVGSPCNCRSVGVATPAPKGVRVQLPGGTATPAPTPRGKFSNARKTLCVSTHLHASQMEAAVCNRLTHEYAADKLHRLVQQVRLPLLRLAESDGRLKYITVDFGVIHKSEQFPGLIRLIEAKNPKRVSRDWPARKRACELSWGVTIEEVSS